MDMVDEYIFLAFVTGGSNDVQKADILINHLFSNFNHSVSSLTSRDTCSVGTFGSSNIPEEFLCISTTFLGCLSCISVISVTKECYQIGLLESPTRNIFFS